MNFELKADGTFTCHEEIDSQIADYRGKWIVKGGKVELNQTHKGNKPEKDHLSGAAFGNKMDLELKRGAIPLPIILIRK